MERKQRFSIKKLSIGVVSVCIGYLGFVAPVEAKADTGEVPSALVEEQADLSESASLSDEGEEADLVDTGEAEASPIAEEEQASVGVFRMASTPTTIYVKNGGTGDGTSEAQALGNLSDAVTKASNGDTIKLVDNLTERSTVTVNKVVTIEGSSTQASLTFNEDLVFTEDVFFKNVNLHAISEGNKVGTLRAHKGLILENVSTQISAQQTAQRPALELSSSSPDKGQLSVTNARDTVFDHISIQKESTVMLSDNVRVTNGIQVTTAEDVDITTQSNFIGKLSAPETNKTKLTVDGANLSQVDFGTFSELKLSKNATVSLADSVTTVPAKLVLETGTRMDVGSRTLNLTSLTGDGELSFTMEGKLTVTDLSGSPKITFNDNTTTNYSKFDNKDFVTATNQTGTPQVSLNNGGTPLTKNGEGKYIYHMPYNVFYEFESQTEDHEELPEEVEDLLPPDVTDSPNEVAAPQAITDTVRTAEGEWQFVAWKESESSTAKWRIYVGTWKFVENGATPDPEPVETTRIEDLPFETRYEANETLDLGRKETKQAGEKGSKTITESNGQVREVITKDPVDEIIWVGTKSLIIKLPIPFKEVREDDPTLPKGETVVVREGVNGQQGSGNTYTVDSKTGDLVATPVPSFEPIDRLVKVGTKETQTDQVRTEEIPFATQYEADPTRTAGEKHLKQAGETGQVTITIKPDGTETRQVTKTAVPKILQVGTKPVSREEAMAFEQVEQPSDELEVGQRQVITQGQEGLRRETTTYTLDLTTGQVTPSTQSEVITQPVTQVVKVGTATVTYEDTAYTISYEADDTAAYGTERVKTQGQKGRVKVTNRPGKEPLREEVTKAVPEVRIKGTKPSVTTQILAFETETQEDPELNKGQEEELQAGVNGELTITTSYQLDPVTGNITSTRSETRTEPRPRIIKVGTKVVTVTEQPIPYTTRYEADDTKEVGSRAVKQAGQAGVLTITTTNGKAEEVVTKKPQVEIISVGTKPWMEVEVIPFTTEFIEDPDLLKGQEEVIRPGVDGSLETTHVYSVNEETGELEPKLLQALMKGITRLVKVGTKVVTVTEKEIPYTTRYEADDTREAGSRAVKQAGQAGVLTITTTNGKAEEAVTKEPLAEIILIGTKPSTETRVLAFETETQKDPALTKGQEVEVQAGVNGKLVVTTSYQLDSASGELTPTRTETRTEPISRIVKLGTKPQADQVRTEEVPFETRYEADPTRPAFDKQLKQAGETGQVTITIKPDGTETRQVTKEPQVEIISVGTKPSTETRVLAFETETQKDPALTKGQEVEVQAGVNGKLVVTTSYQLDSTSGELTPTRTETRTEPISRIVKLGTKETSKDQVPESPDQPKPPVQKVTKEQLVETYVSGKLKVTEIYEITKDAKGELISKTLLERYALPIETPSKEAEPDLILPEEETKDKASSPAQKEPQVASKKPESPRASQALLPKTGDQSSAGLVAGLLTLMSLAFWRKKEEDEA